MGLSIQPPFRWSRRPPAMDSAPGHPEQISHYDLLGLPRTALASALQATYTRRRQQLVARATEAVGAYKRARWTTAVRALDAAAAVLLDPARRAAYDQSLATGEQARAPAETPRAPMLSRAERAQEAFQLAVPPARPAQPAPPAASETREAPSPVPVASARVTGLLRTRATLLAMTAGAHPQRRCP